MRYGLHKIGVKHMYGHLSMVDLNRNSFGIGVFRCLHVSPLSMVRSFCPPFMDKVSDGLVCRECSFSFL